MFEARNAITRRRGCMRARCNHSAARALMLLLVVVVVVVVVPPLGLSLQVRFVVCGIRKWCERFLLIMQRVLKTRFYFCERTFFFLLQDPLFILYCFSNYNIWKLFTKKFITLSFFTYPTRSEKLKRMIFFNFTHVTYAIFVLFPCNLGDEKFVLCAHTTLPP